MKVAITGHRPNKLGNDYTLKSPLVAEIVKELQCLVDSLNPTEMISGMALGIDTIWAVLAIKNRIPLTAAVPCQNHESKWPEASQKLYRRLLNDPVTTKRLITDGPYTPQCMQVRNIFMVDRCDVLIAVWDGTKGGTYNCIKYAESVNKEIIIVDLNKFKK